MAGNYRGVSRASIGEVDMTQQEQLEAILGQLQFIAWNDGVDFGKGIGGKADDIDKAIGEATQAITALIQEAVNDELRRVPKQLEKKEHSHQPGGGYGQLWASDVYDYCIRRAEKLTKQGNSGDSNNG